MHLSASGDKVVGGEQRRGVCGRASSSEMQHRHDVKHVTELCQQPACHVRVQKWSLDCEFAIALPFRTLIFAVQAAELTSLQVQDLGSSNKLFVNKSKVEEARLEDGDEMAFGPPTDDPNVLAGDEEGGWGQGGYLYKFQIRAPSKRPRAQQPGNEDGQGPAKARRTERGKEKNSVALSAGAVEHILLGTFRCEGPWKVQVLELNFVKEIQRWRSASRSFCT
jgi:hypothetical protein